MFNITQKLNLTCIKKCTHMSARKGEKKDRETRIQ